jgi:hypothetical protein
VFLDKKSGIYNLKLGNSDIMDTLLAICRGLLLFLEQDDLEMSTLFAKSFLVMNEQYISE